MTLTKSIMRNIAAAGFSVCIFAPAMFMALDRDPPYERVSGKIVPDNPTPGGTIETEWKIRTLRTCAPSSTRNVTRQIVDSHGTVWDFDEIPSVFGRELTARNDDPDRIVRIFPLPPAIATGPAKYRSRACFACNPTQYLWPVCVDRPDIQFNIGEQPQRRPNN